MNAQTHLLYTRLLFVCLVVTLSQNPENNQMSGSSSTPAGGSASERSLVVGTTNSDVISAGQSRFYTFNVKAGEYARIELKRQDLQLTVSLCDDEGKSCRRMLGRRFGPLDLSFAAGSSGIYKIEVNSTEKELGEKPYELTLVEITTTTSKLLMADQASLAKAQAEQLREQQNESSQLAATAKYSDASRKWRAAGEFGRAAEALCDTGDVYFALSQFQRSLTEYQNALSLSERNGDQQGVLSALNGIAYAYTYLGENDKARSYATQVLDTVERLTLSDDFRRAEAAALNTIGEVDYAEGALRKSIEVFEHAHSLYVTTGDRGGQALSFLNLGYSRSDLGEAQKASEDYQRALVQFQSVSDMRGSTLAQTALGGFYSLLGEEDKALSLHKAASDFFHRMGNKQGEAAALNGIARAYQDLNDYDSALESYNKALRLHEELGQRSNIALGKFLVARVLYQKGQVEQATQDYSESLTLSRAAGDRITEAHALKGLGSVYFSRDDTKNAVSHYEAALQIYRALGNRRSEAYVLNDLAHINTHAHNLVDALAYLEQALPLMRATGDRHGEALTLFNTAKAELARGDPVVALKSIEDSIAIGESLRTKTNNSQLRTSYFASVNEQYELYVDILMSLHAHDQEKGYAISALLASERGRARSLLDSLLASKIESQKTASAELLAQIQNVLESLNEKAEYQTRLLAQEHKEDEADKVAQEMRDLVIQYQGLRATLRTQNPSQATLIDPAELKLDDVQKLVNGADATLLEFTLGQDRSYVWAISGTEVVSYELPDRATIEALARKVYDSATVRQSIDENLTPQQQEKLIRDADAAFREHSTSLSTMLLGPVASRLRSKHLLIVGDGLLHSIPFDALPLPAGAQSGGEPELLVSAHQITILPSALTLVALRLRNSAANKTIEVIADPVFERDDPRVLSRQKQGAAHSLDQSTDVYFSSALRDFTENGTRGHISRLPATLQEAKAIDELGPAGDVVTSTGFDANKQKFVSAPTHGYRVLHIATHGLINVEHPDLSGLVFSLLDEEGRSVDGFLRLPDIYNLDLSADLVVLSACRTGLGPDVKGEGVVGLTTGFMYAGAKTVVSSLWKVDDTATAEFMSYFYRALLKDGLPPGEALRTAKLEMQKQERWRAPFYWAGFVLQGEYANPSMIQKSASRFPLAVIIVAVLLIVGSTYAFARYRWRKSRL
jgi:CHAT domain-containing protein